MLQINKSNPAEQIRYMECLNCSAGLLLRFLRALISEGEHAGAKYRTVCKPEYKTGIKTGNLSCCPAR